MKLTLTPAQARVLALIKSGRVTTAYSDTRQGRTVEALIRKGAVRAGRKFYEQGGFAPGRGYRRYVKGSWYYADLVVEKGMS